MTPHMLRVLRREAAIREFHLLEQPLKRFAELAGVSYSTAVKMAKTLGLRFSKAWGWRNGQTLPNQQRADVMAALYRDGYILEEIGQQYGITRERVRQILSKHKRMNGSDGGQHVRAERQRVKREAARNARFLKKWGCTYQQWHDLHRLGLEQRAAGRPMYQTPLYAYRSQENNAKRRGIGWEFTLWTWWTVWQESGHWAERGRGQGYCMCRNGDTGPYAMGNVYIAKAAQNSSDGQVNNHRRKDPSLPLGVRRTKSGKFAAFRHLNGRPLRLGTHATPELAYAAYLMAGQSQREAA